MVTKQEIRERLRNITLLYVEDDGDVLEQMSEVLERWFSKVITAHNGQEGLEAYRNDHPDVIITDIKMPLMDGIQMSEAIRQEDTEVIIITVTAHNEIEIIQRADKAAITTYLTKPIDIDRLMQTLYTLLESRR